MTSGKSVGVDDDRVISTPEGDNEYSPGEPIGPLEGLEVPSGSAPVAYDADVNNGMGDGTVPHTGTGAETEPQGHEKGIVEKVFDKLSIGQILT